MSGVKLKTTNFPCAICRRMVEMRWNRQGPGEIMPPLCIYCERDYSRGVGKPSEGTYRDRRLYAQGVAIAEALRCEAARQSWPEAWRATRGEA